MVNMVNILFTNLIHLLQSKWNSDILKDTLAQFYYLYLRNVK